MVSPLSATEMYQYTALGPEDSDSRLLRLLKGSGPEIECELSPRSLQNGHLRWYASYISVIPNWHGSVKKHVIACNFDTLTVPTRPDAFQIAVFEESASGGILWLPRLLDTSSRPYKSIPRTVFSCM
jgi:hypothetical protein